MAPLQPANLKDKQEIFLWRNNPVDQTKRFFIAQRTLRTGYGKAMLLTLTGHAFPRSKCYLVNFLRRRLRWYEYE